VRPIRVLLVEDNPGDADLTRETLEGSKLRIEIAVVVDGAAAVSYLRKEGAHAGVPTPDLILLDLNLPKVSGRDVLAEVKTHEDLCTIPVVVLTSSDAERDIVESYALGASCFVTKPVGFHEFQSIVRSIEGFWFTVVRYP